MSYAEARQYEQEWFLALDQRLQTVPFATIPRLRLVRRGATEGGRA